METIRVSPSSLSIFEDCPRCFWLQMVEKIRRPRGVFPSLPGGMDALIKNYFDQYRAQGTLPPELEGVVEGGLFADQAVLDGWRNWRKGLTCDIPGLNAQLSGAVDDCLVTVSGKYIPLDYKTHGYGPKEGHGEKYYQSQLNCYALLLEKNKRPVESFAYLVYYVPREMKGNGDIHFSIEVQKIQTNVAEAENLVRQAVNSLSQAIPQRASECVYCDWFEQQIEKRVA
ncbi:MAG: PD-(D/E)XK nuclease family protein [Deltaproteobacteria bacterium]|nr:PD-(D/E)XK nuclease family protein [Deltaproteobacteria bacterium]